MPKSQQEWENLLVAKLMDNVNTTAEMWLGLDDLEEQGNWTWNFGSDVWREADWSGMWTLWVEAHGGGEHAAQPDGNGDCGVWYTRQPPADWAQTDRWDDTPCDQRFWTDP